MAVIELTRQIARQYRECFYISGSATVRGGALTSKHELGENPLNGVRFVLDRVVVVGNHEEVDRADNLSCAPETTTTQKKKEKQVRSDFWEWLAQIGGEKLWGK